MRLIAAALLLTAALNAWGTEVYRAVGPDGTLVFSDRPSGPDAVPVGISVSTPSPEAASTQAGAPSTSPAETTDTSNPEEVRRLERELAEQRMRNCELARERVENYSQAQRLYRQLENGEREYLSDDEIDEARATAQADVDAWCS